MHSDWMAGAGVAHWLMFVAAASLALVPAGRILWRMGFSPLLSIALLIPIVNVIALWILAFIQWPMREREVG